MNNFFKSILFEDIYYEAFVLRYVKLFPKKSLRTDIFLYLFQVFKKYSRIVIILRKIIFPYFDNFLFPS